MTQFSREDDRGTKRITSARDVIYEADSDQDGAGDHVFRTGGVERARLTASGKGSGLFGSSLTYIARPTGVAATDVAVIQAAHDAASDGDTLILGKGTYLLNAGLTISKAITLRGDKNEGTILKAASGLTGTLLSVSPSASTSFIEVCEFGINMTLATGQVAVSLDNLGSGSKVHDIYVDSGTYGFTIANSSSVFFSNLYPRRCSSAGIQVNGDGGSDLRFRDCIIDCPGGSTQYGFEYVRTTATDTGALYLSNVLAEGTTEGFYAHSTVANTFLGLFMERCVWDGIVNHPMWLVNMWNTRVTSSWFWGPNGNNYAVTIDGGKTHYFTSGNNIDGSSTAGAFEFLNSPKGIVVTDNVIPSGTVFKFTTSQVPQRLHWAGNDINGTTALTNDYTLLPSALNPQLFPSAPPDFVIGGTTVNDTLGLKRASSTGKHKWLRVNSSGDLEVVSDGYTSVVAAIYESGGIGIGGGTQIKKHLSATATWDPASVSAGSQTTTTVTVTGSAVGDTVAVGFSNDLQAMQLTGYVSAANTVTVVLRNGTGGAIDLASGTLRADVWQH